ncbi:MAG: hypothetical protein M1816_004205 [Peltula sp. TS41687]|nr:MAG: hypothetical protein M1816_004205 [Peltula sp. TS41687]
MPRSRSRSRSRSPRRDPRRRRSPYDGRDGLNRPRRKDAGFRWKGKRRDDDQDTRDDRRLERGYRQRDRSRSPPREQVVEEKAAPKPTSKGSSTSTVAPSNEPMIIVNVNDRLGTKAAIPCLASDPIGLFKAQVAARIGRQPHEILLKRQGERPFKDGLTLEDYGVSNGVQLDLELDTGD